MKIRMRTVIGMLLVAVGLVVASDGYGQIIRNVTTSRVAFSDSGPVRIETIVRNTGDAAAYHMTVTNLLGALADKSDDLGDNPPGGVVRYEWLIPPRDLKPGNYVLVTRLNFEEQGGAQHRAYHFSPVAYGLAKNAEPSFPVKAVLDSPRINKKALWGKSNIKLTLKNGHREAVEVHAAFYLPDGLSTREPERHYQLRGGEEQEDEIAVKLDPAAFQTGNYRAVIWYEADGVIHSEMLDGNIEVEDAPVLFKVFAAGMLSVILIAAGVMFYRKRKKGD